MNAAPLDAAELAADTLPLRVFVDRGSVEVYVNDGHQVLSSYDFPVEGPRAGKRVSESRALQATGGPRHHHQYTGCE